MSGNERNSDTIVETERVQNLERNQDIEMYDVYANQIRMGVTLSDFSLVFGAIADRGKQGSHNVDKCIVRLAPITFKQLYIQMSATLEAYEQSVGKIPTSKKIVDGSKKIQKVLSINLKEQLS
ncbi:hypothetical protein KTQ54_06320 [Komagataeibacter oboediens]|uniref:hypothetical protein n=1 Tax=Komagataeibacter oboediens TaxID=65958 RepID=UPI001C2BA6F0|nr:hypothetical protein [Komagataeibacter oboediens]MBV0888152.1 hypothetical protein [Komagataeibacter oboediens]MCK9820746.1 hypothetical protein [Komagataeibacter oboediens]